MNTQQSTNNRLQMIDSSLKPSQEERSYPKHIMAGSDDKNPTKMPESKTNDEYFSPLFETPIKKHSVDFAR